MREKLIAYVDLLFSGVADADDIKQEILQNTLDRYDDLLAQGKTQEAAYTLSISGIGDITELLGSTPEKQQVVPEPTAPTPIPAKSRVRKKVAIAVAICLYILCPIPVLILTNELGLCGLLAMIAIATGILIATGEKKEVEKEKKEEQPQAPSKQMRKSIHSAISTAGLCCYFITSFLTGAWHITWLIFPIVAAITGLVNACLDMKEDK